MPPPTPCPSLIRVAVQSHYPSARVGLRAMLSLEPGILVVEDLPAEDGADVFVADLDGPPPGDMDLAAVPSVLLVASPAEMDGLISASGVPRAVLLKESGGPEIAAAVRAVFAGLIVLDPAIVAPFLSHFRPDQQIPEFDTATLTAREVEVLRLVATGLPNKAIALQLGISDHTVKFHVGTILGKLGAASRAEAAARAVRAGILPL